jgi:hypothetical protein
MRIPGGGKFLGLIGLALTFLKPFFAGGIIILLADRNDKIAAAAILLLMVFDIFDGVLFGHSPYSANTKLERLRRWGDSIGDRFAIHTVLVSMILLSGLPIGFYVVALVRDILIGAVFAYGYTSHTLVERPNLSSRLASFSVGLMAIAWLTAGMGAALACAGPTILFGSIGLAQYYKTMRTA